MAQIVDGALGMAYGVTSSSFLLAVGASPIMASGATHLAEVFTTGISGMSHLRMGNVNRKLFLSLLIPGVTGGLIGTYVLSSIDGAVLKPWISGYLLLMGLYVFFKAFGADPGAHRDASLRASCRWRCSAASWTAPAAAAGAPSSPPRWSAAGHDPRTTIGSVNFAEFFLTMTIVGRVLLDPRRQRVDDRGRVGHGRPVRRARSPPTSPGA